MTALEEMAGSNGKTFALCSENHPLIAATSFDNFRAASSVSCSLVTYLWSKKRYFQLNFACEWFPYVRAWLSYPTSDMENEQFVVFISMFIFCRRWDGCVAGDGEQYR